MRIRIKGNKELNYPTKNHLFFYLRVFFQENNVNKKNCTYSGHSRVYLNSSSVRGYSASRRTAHYVCLHSNLS